MKRLLLLEVIIVLCLITAPLACFALERHEGGVKEGTRQDHLGWQHADFEDNIELDYSPINPNPAEPIVITVRSKEPDVDIQIAYAEMTAIFPGGAVSTGGRTFQRVSETEMKTSIGPYAYNGTMVTFFVNVLDYNNVPMLSPDIEVTVLGVERTGGWIHDEFEENILLSRDPLLPNATEPVTITITSLEGVPIEGANLYFLYTSPGQSTESGGWSFERVNLTVMTREIPGNFHTAGTNITFWAVVWDEYSNLTKSEPFNYTIPGIIEYRYPFEYTQEGNVTDNSYWYPNMAILVSLIMVSAIGIPAFAYLHSSESRRMGKTEDLIRISQTKDTTKGGNSEDDNTGEE